MRKYIITILAIYMSVSSLIAQDIDINKRPSPAKTSSIKLKKPVSFVLDNGLKVLFVENHKLPRVIVSIENDIPPIYEGDKAGSLALLSMELGKGSKNMSKEEFDKRLDFLGANVNIGSNVSAVMLSRYFEEIMTMISDALLNPVFDINEIEKSKTQILESIRSNEKNAQSLSKKLSSALMYGANTAQGEFMTEKSVQSITKDDIERMYKRFSQPSSYYMVVIGDLTESKLKEVLSNTFAKWRSSSDEKISFTNTSKQLDKVEIDVVNLDNAVQSIIKVVNFHDLNMNSKDYFAAKIANYILGGGSLDSRLNMNLREKNAFTYGAGSSLSNGKYSKVFSASTSVRNEVTAAAVKEIINEMRGMDSISEEDLENAKKQFKGSFIMSLESPSTIANQEIVKMQYNLPESFYADYLKSVDAVSLDDVKAAAKKYILADKARIIIVGKASDFLEDLKKLNYPIHMYNTDAEYLGKE